MTVNKRPCTDARDFIEGFYKECRPNYDRNKRQSKSRVESHRGFGKPKQQAIELTDEEFYDIYMVQRLSTREILEKYHWGTPRLQKMIKKLGLKRDPVKNRPVCESRVKMASIDEEEFRRLYIDQNLRLMDVAQIMGISSSAAEVYRSEKGIMKGNSISGWSPTGVNGTKVRKDKKNGKKPKRDH